MCKMCLFAENLKIKDLYNININSYTDKSYNFHIRNETDPVDQHSKICGEKYPSASCKLIPPAIGSQSLPVD